MIVLFDVDGTLVTTGGAGREAYEAAFAERFGVGHDLLEFSFSGLTDPIIIRRGIEAAGRDVEPKLVDDLIERYLSHLPERIESAADYTVHPGAPELLAELTGRAGVAVGLGTGNIERGARLKLEPAGLNDHAEFGGFGSDAEERADLLRAGVERGGARLGRDPSEVRVVVIGDTARDIRAARDLGADVLAVNTGSYDETQLRDADPDCFVEDLTHPTARTFLELDP